jgi:short-subunit dehydrogenase
MADNIIPQSESRPDQPLFGVETRLRDSVNRPFAVVTGASTGIGYELAKCCAANGFNLLVVADEAKINEAAQDFRALGAEVDALEADLATTEGVDELLAAVKNRPVDALLANAGRGLGKGFLDQEFPEVRRVVDTNITGTIYLLHKIGNHMRTRGQGRILIVGSIAGFIPGTFSAVYNGTKAFIDSFSFALRNELKDSGVTVTCLMPGPTETEFFERADMMDTRVGQAKKDDPDHVAKTGFAAMMRGDGDVVTGWKNKAQSAIASVTPSGALAQMHRLKAEPGSGERSRAWNSRHLPVNTRIIYGALGLAAALFLTRRFSLHR